MSVFYIKRGDRRKSIEEKLVNGDGSTPDLSGATTVRFLMRPRPDHESEKVNAAATIVTDGTGGDDAVVRYDWADGDTDTAGDFDAEWEVLKDGKRGTYPDDGYTIVRIAEDLGDAP